jgi:hypothetical protein
MAYVYRHIRLDTNQPFYIGISSDTNYKRAYTKSRRNAHWRNIIQKTKYEVKILLDDLTWEQACEKEMEFIALYGRTDLNTGILCNKTLGGEGFLGVKRDPFSESERIRKEKIKFAKIGKKRPDLSLRNRLRGGEQHPYYGKSSPKLGKQDPKARERALTPVTCPHCSKVGQKMVMNRWHFDNCKQKTK